MAIRGRPTRQAIYERLAAEVAELRNRLGGLPTPDEAEGIWADLWHQEAHNSTALEGNTLVLREVEALLEQGRALGQKELKDYLEVKGYAQAAEWVYGQALHPDAWSPDTLLTLTEVRQVHRLAMGSVWAVSPHPAALAGEGPGDWRRHNIQPFGRGMIPPDHTDVPPRMHDWVESVCRISQNPSVIAEVIASQHAAFERIHPFLDGNGRAGRLLINLVLVRLGYPPAIIQKRDRGRYLAALDRADQGDDGPLGELIARSVLDNLRRFVLPAVAGPARLVPLETLATNDLTVTALRAAAQRERLRALRAADGTWRSSRKWVDEYRASRKRTGRPRGIDSG